MTTFTFADHSRSVSLKSSRRTFGQGRVPAPLTAESEGAVAPTGARRQIKHGGCPWSDTWSHFKARERHWSAVISSERQSVRLKVRGEKPSIFTHRPYEGSWMYHHLNVIQADPGVMRTMTFLQLPKVWILIFQFRLTPSAHFYMV